MKTEIEIVLDCTIEVPTNGCPDVLRVVDCLNLEDALSKVENEFLDYDGHDLCNQKSASIHIYELDEDERRVSVKEYSIFVSEFDVENQEWTTQKFEFDIDSPEQEYAV